MKYFLTVKNKVDVFSRTETQFENLNEVLRIVSGEYLLDPDIPHRWTGYFALRDGHISWLKVNSLTAGDYLRNDIAGIDILSERGLLERKTFEE